MTVNIFNTTAIRRVPLTLYGRCTAISTGANVASPDGRGYLLKQADVSSILVTAYVNGVSVGTDTPAVSSVIYDTLQTGNNWDTVGDVNGKPDRLGGNARYTVPAALVTAGQRKVDIEIMFTLTDGSLAPWLVTVEATDGRM